MILVKLGLAFETTDVNHFSRSLRELCGEALGDLVC